MSSYQEKQFKLFKELEKRFKKGEKPSSVVELMKDYASDNRICLTSVVFIPQKLQKTILQRIINPLKQADKRQYYYLPESLHLTIQNIKQEKLPPSFTNSDIEKVKKVFKEVIFKYKKFSFNLKGLFEMPTSLSICGYSNELLKHFVLESRGKLQQAGVPDDKKYASDNIFFGNITICRYTTKPNEDFFREVKKLKNINIEKIEVKRISLITTNSVCFPDKTEIIEKYDLG